MENKCDRLEEDCWFGHVKPVGISPKKNMPVNSTPRDTTDNQSNLQGFWESPPNLVPPKQVLDMKAIMKTIEETVQETMKKFMKEINWSSYMSK